MSQSVLEMNHISKSYRDGGELYPVLRDISLTVREGEFAAVVGPSGSGKSTLLAIAGMMLAPDAGQLSLKGRELTGARQKDWTKLRRKYIGFIFQSHELLPYLRAYEQLSLFREKGGNAAVSVHDSMEELGLESCQNKYPAQMSGGEKQRVAIARAFINDPTLILADEPTASLDVDRGRQAVEMIRRSVQKQGKAAVMVTHDERVLDLVDTVYRLENGTLKRTGE